MAALKHYVSSYPISSNRRVKRCGNHVILQGYSSRNRKRNTNKAEFVSQVGLGIHFIMVVLKPCKRIPLQFRHIFQPNNDRLPPLAVPHAATAPPPHACMPCSLSVPPRSRVHSQLSQRSGHLPPIRTTRNSASEQGGPKERVKGARNGLLLLQEEGEPPHMSRGEVMEARSFRVALPFPPLQQASATCRLSGGEREREGSTKVIQPPLAI